MLLEFHARLVLLLHVLQLPFLEGADVARTDALQERREHLSRHDVISSPSLSFLLMFLDIGHPRQKAWETKTVNIIINLAKNGRTAAIAFRRSDWPQTYRLNRNYTIRTFFFFLALTRTFVRKRTKKTTMQALQRQLGVHLRYPRNACGVILYNTIPISNNSNTERRKKATPTPHQRRHLRKPCSRENTPKTDSFANTPSPSLIRARATHQPSYCSLAIYCQHRAV